MDRGRASAVLDEGREQVAAVGRELVDGGRSLSPDEAFELAGDIQRQVFRIDHAVDKLQILGQQVAVEFLDQNLTGVQLQPRLLAQGERAALWTGWNVQQGVELHGSVHH